MPVGALVQAFSDWVVRGLFDLSDSLRVRHLPTDGTHVFVIKPTFFIAWDSMIPPARILFAGAKNGHDMLHQPYKMK